MRDGYMSFSTFERGIATYLRGDNILFGVNPEREQQDGRQDQREGPEEEVPVEYEATHRGSSQEIDYRKSDNRRCEVISTIPASTSSLKPEGLAHLCPTPYTVVDWCAKTRATPGYAFPPHIDGAGQSVVSRC